MDVGCWVLVVVGGLGATDVALFEAYSGYQNDFFRENSDLIKDGLRYHHVIILRRSILRNLSSRKKKGINHLLLRPTRKKNLLFDLPEKKNFSHVF